MLISRAPDSAPIAAVARVLRVAVGLAVVLLAVWVLSRYLFLVFLCVLIAAMLCGLSELLCRVTRMHKMPALACVVVALVGLLGLFLWYVGPELAQQSTGLWKQVSDVVGRLRQEYGDTPFGRMIADFSPQSESARIASSAASIAGTTVGGLVTVFLVFVISVYFALSPGLYLDGLVMLLPRDYRDRAREILMHVGRTLQFWLLGQAVDMVVVGLLTYAGLVLLGVKLPVALAVLAGLLTFVPYFGAIAAAVPAILVAMTDGWQKAAWVAVLFVVVHSVDGYLVSPLVQRRTVDMPPAMTILAMTVLGGLAGALGVILAAPLAAATLVLVREAYVEDVLNERARRTAIEAQSHGAPG
jgi:predicted PurR-regulated permease PerM